MSSNNTDHSGVWHVHHDVQIDATDIDSSDAARISAKVIRYLPLIAANDFLDQEVDLPPVA